MTTSILHNRSRESRKRTNRNVNIRAQDKFWHKQAEIALPHEDRHSPLTLTISANFGMFSDMASQPSSPISYPAPTFGALVNILRHLSNGMKAGWVPLGVEFLNPINYTSFSFNLTGPERKRIHHTKGTNSMFHHAILVRPRFRIYFAMVARDGANPMAPLQVLQRKVRSGNHRDLFMGQREYPLDVEYSTDEPVREEINFVLPSMLRQIVYGANPGIEVLSSVFCSKGRLVYPATFDTVSQISA